LGGIFERSQAFGETPTAATGTVALLSLDYLVSA